MYDPQVPTELQLISQATTALVKANEAVMEAHTAINRLGDYYLDKTALRLSGVNESVHMLIAEELGALACMCRIREGQP